MGLFDKLKNVLFEEEIIEETVETPVKIETPKEAPLNIPKIKREEVKEYNPIEETDRELFNAEKTFDFPSFDEEEFEDFLPKKKIIEEVVEPKKEKIVESRVEERQQIIHEKPSRVVERERRIPESSVAVKTKKDDTYDRHRETISRIAKTSSTPIKKSVFKPSPVISPVYGVLDKNYKKEDVLTREEVASKKNGKLDVDSVRKKAFGALEEDLEKTISKPIKELFNDLDEGSKVEVKLEVKEELPIIESAKLIEEAEELEKELETFLEENADVEIDVTKEMELPTLDNINTYEEDSIEDIVTGLADEENDDMVSIQEENDDVEELSEDIQEDEDDEFVEYDDIDNLTKKEDIFETYEKEETPEEAINDMEELEDIEDSEESDLFDLIDSMYEDKEDED